MIYEVKDYKKEFLTAFHKFLGRYSSWQVWNDFLTLSACSMVNVVPTPEREKREEEYLSVIKRYAKEDQERFSELFGILVLALEDNPEQDFLGEMYAGLELSQHQKGQFFTPYHISEFMAEIQCGDTEQSEEIQKKGYVSVHDPACGSGIMLMAFANCMRKHGFPYQEKVLFIAQDIDRTAALMCYIQLSLLGCPGIIIIGDSLARPGFHPENEVWMTLFYHLNAWGFQNFGKEQDRNDSAVVLKSGREYKEEAGGQLTHDLKESA